MTRIIEFLQVKGCNMPDQKDKAKHFSDTETREQSKKRFILDTEPKIAKLNDVDDSTKRFKYLLGLTDLFRYFIDLNASKDTHFKKIIKQIDNNVSFKQPTTKKKKRRKTETRTREKDAI